MLAGPATPSRDGHGEVRSISHGAHGAAGGAAAVRSLAAHRRRAGQRCRPAAHHGLDVVDHGRPGRPVGRLPVQRVRPGNHGDRRPAGLDRHARRGLPLRAARRRLAGLLGLVRPEDAGGLRLRQPGPAARERQRRRRQAEVPAVQGRRRQRRHQAGRRLPAQRRAEDGHL
eukprot:SAG22_NODE_203_length_15320_cov_14.023516_5_plen_171_part_00